MSDKVVVESFLANEDDIEHWGDAIERPEVTGAGKRRLNTVISIRFAQDELEEIRDASGGANLSRFIRDTLLHHVREIRRGVHYQNLLVTFANADSSFAEISFTSPGMPLGASAIFGQPMIVTGPILQASTDV